MTADGCLAEADINLAPASELKRHTATEFGMLPKDWNFELLCNIAFVTSGKRLPKGTKLTEKPTPHPYIRVSDMRQSKVDDSGVLFVPEDVAPYIRRYRIFADDLFISVAGTLGIVGRIPKELDGANLTENADRITNITCSKNFLLHVLLSNHVQRIIADTQTVGAQPKLALTRIRSFQIPLPPTSQEQEAIAEALSDADALIEGLERLIAKKRLIKEGAMQELLSGARRLPGFDRPWRVVDFQNDAVLKARIGWQGLTTSEYLDRGDYALVTGTEFVDGSVNWKSCHFVNRVRYEQDPNIQLRDNDVILTKDGTIGKAAFIQTLPIPATLNSGVFVIRPKGEGFHPRYIYYVLRSQIFLEFLNKLSAGSTINHLYQKDFTDFRFKAPADLVEQERVAETLADIDREIEALNTKLAKARQIKQGMMQDLLTGRIRLV